MKKAASVRNKMMTGPYLLWSALFIIAPMIFVAYYAFTDRTGAFTFQNIMNISDYYEIFLRSIWYSFIATAICILIAYPLAYIIAQTTESIQQTMVMLVMLPMWMNFLIRTYTLQVLLQDTGIINNLLTSLGLNPVHIINTSGAVILGMIYNFLPFMVLPIYSVMAKMDRSLIEAAQDLGSGKLTILKRVIFPLSVPGVVSGITMVFVPSVSTFYISQKLGGANHRLIGDSIEALFQGSSLDYNLGAALSLALMILVLLSLAFMNRFTDSEEAVLL